MSRSISVGEGWAEPRSREQGVLHPHQHLLGALGRVDDCLRDLGCQIRNRVRSERCGERVAVQLQVVDWRRVGVSKVPKRLIAPGSSCRITSSVISSKATIAGGLACPSQRGLVEHPQELLARLVDLDCARLVLPLVGVRRRSAP